MTYHKRIDTRLIPAGPKKTETITEMLQAERQAYRSVARGSADETVVARNIDDLEAALEQSQKNDHIREENAKTIAAERKTKADERQAADEMALKEQLRVSFRAGNPGATEADFDRLYPQLRDAHLVREANASMDEARKRIRI